MSSIHLAINNPGIIYGITNDELSRKGRKWMPYIVMTSSIFNPVLLLNAYTSVKEKIKEKMETSLEEAYLLRQGLKV